MKKTCLFSLLLAVLLTSTGYAHLNSVSYSTIEIKEDEIVWEMKFTLLCTLELFSVDQDSDNFLSKEELKSAWMMMYYYLSNKLKVLTDGKQLNMKLRDISFEVEEEDSYTVFNISYPYRTMGDSVLFVCNVQEETDPYHRNLAEITFDDSSYIFVFSNVNYFDTLHIPRSARKLEAVKKGDGVQSATETITVEPSGENVENKEDDEQ